MVHKKTYYQVQAIRLILHFTIKYSNGNLYPVVVTWKSASGGFPGQGRGESPWQEDYPGLCVNV